MYPQSLFRLAYVNDTLVGYLLLFPYFEDERHRLNIVRLMIDQHHQRQGHGKALLRSALELARSMTPAIEVVRISTLPRNEPALNLYRSFGFIESGMEDGEIALYLELESWR